MQVAGDPSCDKCTSHGRNPYHKHLACTHVCVLSAGVGNTAPTRALSTSKNNRRGGGHAARLWVVALPFVSLFVTLSMCGCGWLVRGASVRGGFLET